MAIDFDDDNLRLTPAQAIEALAALDGDDPEATHARVDTILRAVVDPEVRDACYAVMDRCGWWACA